MKNNYSLKLHFLSTHSVKLMKCMSSPIETSTEKRVRMLETEVFDRAHTLLLKAQYELLGTEFHDDYYQVKKALDAVTSRLKILRRSDNPLQNANISFRTHFEPIDPQRPQVVTPMAVAPPSSPSYHPTSPRLSPTSPRSSPQDCTRPSYSPTTPC